MCSLYFGSEPQQINYSQTRTFKRPDLDLIGGSVQDTWNSPHSIKLLDCQWLSQATEWLALVPSKQHCRLAQSLIADQWDCQQEGMHFRHPTGHLTCLGIIQTGSWTTTCKCKWDLWTIDKQMVGIYFHFVITLSIPCTELHSISFLLEKINCLHFSIIYFGHYWLFGQTFIWMKTFVRRIQELDKYKYNNTNYRLRND